MTPKQSLAALGMLQGKKTKMNHKYEKMKILEGFTHIIGCDEVGRGCLAGPVVAAAVALPVLGIKYKVLWKDIRDSKLLSAEKRQELELIIKAHAVAWGIGVVGEKIIDEINIHNASLLAMRRAVDGLLSVVRLRGLLSAARQAEGLHYKERGSGCFLSVDGKFKVPNLNLQQEAIIDGDNKVLSIAAASIIAKVYRDNLMKQLHEKYPLYNLAQHKGYATAEHRQQILKNGLTAIHRLTFCKAFIG